MQSLSNLKRKGNRWLKNLRAICGNNQFQIINPFTAMPCCAVTQKTTNKNAKF